MTTESHVKEELVEINGDIISIEEVLPQEHNVYRINSIKQLYPKVRQKSKAPTFALTYAGTYLTLMQNCDMSEQKAKQVEQAYHNLYKESDAYCENRIEEARQKGYTEVAFNLKVRCPNLHKSVNCARHMSPTAQKERRTINNAFGQSYCALTMRAFNEFGEILKHSPYKFKILPCVTIHDAVYYLIQDDQDTLEFIKVILEKCFEWQELPEIKHSDVHLHGSLSVFYPDWAHEN